MQEILFPFFYDYVPLSFFFFLCKKKKKKTKRGWENRLSLDFIQYVVSSCNGRH